MKNSYKKYNRKKRTRMQKGGNVYEKLDELINLALPANMEQPGANNRLQDKYEEIMSEIPTANEEQLRQSYEEIYLMTTPNRDGFIPINFYNEALIYRLEDIKNKICERINCNEQHQEGGRRKRTRKKRTRRRKGGNEEDCPICMEKISPTEKLTTKCGHNFHRECFIQNCLAELNKGNFDTRYANDEVFQCPYCRGNTKEDCLSDPEVRARYEGQKGPMTPEPEELDYLNDLIDFIEQKLDAVIDNIVDDPDQEENESELFLTELHSKLSEEELTHNQIEIIKDKLISKIDDAEIINNNLDLWKLRQAIEEQLFEFEPQEGGKKKRRKRRTRKQKGCKKKKSKKSKK